MSLLGGLLCSIASAYAVVALVAVLRLRRALAAGATGAATEPVAVSVLKPLHGDEPRLHENLRGYCLQAHPRYQLLFGIQRADDPAGDVVRRLQAEFPALDIELVLTVGGQGLNRKVLNLAGLLPRARHPLLVIADSDIRVPPDYLRRVTAPLQHAGTGLVTCLYFAHGRGFWARLGAQFVNDWFMPSVAMARLSGETRYAFGSTLALRRETLDAIGGFEALADELADDYWIGERVRALGLRTELSALRVVTDDVSTSLRALCEHELRWLRTVRGLRPRGFFALVVSFTWPLALAGLALSPTWPTLCLALPGLLARSALHGLQRADHPEPAALRDLLLTPLRDSLSLALWAWAHRDSTVSWQGRRLDAARGRPS